MTKNWIFVFIAGLIEIAWASLLKNASSPLDYIGIIILLIISFVMLMSSSKDIPVATVYAVFTGIGTAGTVLVGIIVYGESCSIHKLSFIAVLLTGIIGLKLSTKEESQTVSEKKEEL